MKNFKAANPEPGKTAGKAPMPGRAPSARGGAKILKKNKPPRMSGRK